MSSSPAHFRDPSQAPPCTMTAHQISACVVLPHITPLNASGPSLLIHARLMPRITASSATLLYKPATDIAFCRPLEPAHS